MGSSAAGAGSPGTSSLWPWRNLSWLMRASKRSSCERRALRTDQTTPKASRSSSTSSGFLSAGMTTGIIT